MKKKTTIIGVLAMAALINLAGCDSAIHQLEGQIETVGKQDTDEGSQIVPAGETDLNTDTGGNEFVADYRIPATLRPVGEPQPPIFGTKPEIQISDATAVKSPDLGIDDDHMDAMVDAITNMQFTVSTVEWSSPVIKIAFNQARDMGIQGTIALEAYGFFHHYAPERKELRKTGSLPYNVALSQPKTLWLGLPEHPKGVSNLSQVPGEENTVTVEGQSPGLLQNGLNSGQNYSYTYTYADDPTTVAGYGLSPALCNTGTHCESVVYVAKISGFKNAFGKTLESAAKAVIECGVGDTCRPCSDDSEACRAAATQLNRRMVSGL